MRNQSTILNYIDNVWQESVTSNLLDVTNPATGEVLSRVPLSPSEEVNAAASAATTAFEEWRRTPPLERIQYLFKLKNLLEENIDDIAKTITLECGKTLSEAKGEMRRAIENVEVACGIPTLMQGTNLEDIATGIDEFMIRQPIGVCAVIAPFNFPGMITFWFLPYAIACGNTYIVKPSEKVPLTMQKIFRLLEQTGLPQGVVNLVNGGQETVNTILEHPDIQAISFVGSTPTAKAVYAKAAAHGKRVQCQGGAKNPLIILPDADPQFTVNATADSAFGCAGQRCLAASLAIAVGGARNWFPRAISDIATDRIVGNGLDENVQMGPVITPESRKRIEGVIQNGIDAGARVLVDGRFPEIQGGDNGNFIRPTVLSELEPQGEIAKTEIFGPVLGLIHVDNIDAAISLINSGNYGNMACLFTNNGRSARKFRYEAHIGNIGINIGVAAPMAFFPFSGWKDSFFGDLHGQSWDAVDFFTQKKVVVERWN